MYNHIIIRCVCYAVVARNLAITGTATASSNAQNTKAQWAIDGISYAYLDDHSCSLTDTEDEPFWKVTFNETILVHVVSITPRADCCGKS